MYLSFFSHIITDIFFSWETNCAANNETNGVDNKLTSGNRRRDVEPKSGRKLARAFIKDISPSNAIGLPPQFIPSLPLANGSTGVIKSYVLPGNKTGVVRPSNPVAINRILTPAVNASRCLSDRLKETSTSSRPIRKQQSHSSKHQALLV